MNTLNKFQAYLWNKWSVYSLRNFQKQLEDLSFKIQVEQFQYSESSEFFKDSEKSIRNLNLLNQDIENVLTTGHF